KLILIIGDGMSDRPAKELGGKTPLQVANIPNMNEVARKGICGLIDPIAPGIRPGSDVAHLALLGYDPFKLYTGRGPFEAAGVGINVLPGDIAFRCNFATVNEDLIVIDRRAGRIRETQELAEALNEIEIESANVRIAFRASTSHRAALLLKGNLSDKVSDSDPGVTNQPIKKVIPLEKSRKAKNTAEVLNEFTKKAHEILKTHPVNLARVQQGLPPANAILARGAGVVPHLLPITQTYRISAACIAATGLVKGICKMAGMKIIQAPGMTGGIDTDTISKGKAALGAIKEDDFVLLHVKGPDEASHDGDAGGKIKIIERIDQMLGLILNEFKDGYTGIVSDHTTPLSVRNHTGDPVPLAICGEGIRVDHVHEFNEVSVAKGGLLRMRGIYLLPTLMDLLSKAKKIGA
ncbi:MAG: 2,3-bisphosphoglycerate-independent phosphoglycerate mutase, partial [Euryarchaeota archaeon]|nr:2,3-bisphosphoglycerate-independent phosphoglycerate mutase [Euryarchaeota archaeon]